MGVVAILMMTALVVMVVMVVAVIYVVYKVVVSMTNMSCVRVSTFMHKYICACLNVCIYACAKYEYYEL